MFVTTLRLEKSETQRKCIVGLCNCAEIFETVLFLIIQMKIRKL